jgi:hypothetical protein
VASFLEATANSLGGEFSWRLNVQSSIHPIDAKDTNEDPAQRRSTEPHTRRNLIQPQEHTQHR